MPTAAERTCRQRPPFGIDGSLAGATPPYVLHLRDGKVTEFWDAQTDQYGADEFWS